MCRGTRRGTSALCARQTIPGSRPYGGAIQNCCIFLKIRVCARSHVCVVGEHCGFRVIQTSTHTEKHAHERACVLTHYACTGVGYLWRYWQLEWWGFSHRKLRKEAPPPPPQGSCLVVMNSQRRSPVVMNSPRLNAPADSSLRTQNIHSLQSLLGVHS